MWPIFHNVDQLDSIHAAWRLKKGASSTKKVSGIASAAGAGQFESITPPSYKSTGARTEVEVVTETMDGAEATQRTVRWNHGGKGTDMISTFFQFYYYLSIFLLLFFYCFSPLLLLLYLNFRSHILFTATLFTANFRKM